MADESVPSSGLAAVPIALVAITTVALVAGTVGAVAVDGVATDASPAVQTGIDSCTTITQSGKYELTRNLTNVSETCIEITADDVTLDGAGHAVNGSDARFARNTGVRVTNADGVVVRDLTLADWGFAGVYVRGSAASQVRNVTATDSRFGVTVRSSEGVRVAGVNATNNSAAGVDVSTTSGAVVADSLVADNRVGVSLTTTSNSNRVVRNVVRDNRLGVVVSNSDDNAIAENAFCGNREAFVVLERSRGTTFEDNRAC